MFDLGRVAVAIISDEVVTEHLLSKSRLNIDKNTQRFAETLHGDPFVYVGGCCGQSSVSIFNMRLSYPYPGVRGINQCQWSVIPVCVPGRSKWQVRISFIGVLIFLLRTSLCN